jgi:hypothetical protein
MSENKLHIRILMPIIHVLTEKLEPALCREELSNIYDRCCEIYKEDKCFGCKCPLGLTAKRDAEEYLAQLAVEINSDVITGGRFSIFKNERCKSKTDNDCAVCRQNMDN